MPIEKEFDFPNEAAFTTDFLVPLLRRLGFSVVNEYHSSQEFGKDLVFAEIDRFGHVAYHGLQAKYVPSISQSDSNGLIDDAKEAFNNPFQHPGTGTEEHICSFYVANAGSISIQARTNFFNALATPHGGRVRLIDGKALLALDRWGTMHRVEAIGEVLAGLRIEIRYNRLILEVISQRTTEYRNTDGVGPLPIERLRTIATSHYLQRPSLSDHIDTKVVNQYLHVIHTEINDVLNSMMGNTSKENRMRLAEKLMPKIGEAGRMGDGLEAAIDEILKNLGPLLPL